MHYSFCKEMEVHTIVAIVLTAIVTAAVGRILQRRKGDDEMPKAQSIATRKYEASHGWMSKSYKMKRETVEAFAEACSSAGVSQAGQLMKMMNEFIDQNKDESKCEK